MSHIAHNCTCGHFLDMHLPKIEDKRRCSTPGCPCLEPHTAESVVLPTYDVHRNPVPLERPGSLMFGLANRSCTCATCRALYEELTARSGAA